MSFDYNLKNDNPLFYRLYVSRIEELETQLGCTIKQKIEKGTSLEKYFAILNSKSVMLRIYNDDYYTNRFLREGMVLRHLNSHQHELIQTPAIIDEWPEYHIRAIEWLDLTNEQIVTSDDIALILSWLQGINIDLPYSLSDDLQRHLFDLDNIHPAYVEFFHQRLFSVFEQLNWDQGKQVLIHGDFHVENISKVDDRLLVYDWEYASIGSQYYDQAYIKLVHPHLVKKDLPSRWLQLAGLVNSHWYLQEKHFSPKDAIQWIEKLDHLFDNNL